LRDQVIDIVKRRGYRRLDTPVELASGQLSQDFIDGKEALARGSDLKIACTALLELIDDAGIDFDAIGGLTMGADQFAHVIAVLADKDWFVVRKEPKGRGTNKLVEGFKIGPGVRVLLIDDVVTTGGSIQKAHKVVSEIGVEIVGAITLVDRGETASEYFVQRRIPYRSLITYRDLGIEPVNGGLVPA
jgi:orotate phosphoribosyltransferase